MSLVITFLKFPNCDEHDRIQRFTKFLKQVQSHLNFPAGTDHVPLKQNRQKWYNRKNSTSVGVEAPKHLRFPVAYFFALLLKYLPCSEYFI